MQTQEFKLTCRHFSTDLQGTQEKTGGATQDKKFWNSLSQSTGLGEGSSSHNWKGRSWRTAQILQLYLLKRTKTFRCWGKERWPTLMTLEHKKSPTAREGKAPQEGKRRASILGWAGIYYGPRLPQAFWSWGRDITKKAPTSTVTVTEPA